MLTHGAIAADLPTQSNNSAAAAENVLPTVSVKASRDGGNPAENGYQVKRAAVGSRSDAA